MLVYENRNSQKRLVPSAKRRLLDPISVTISFVKNNKKRSGPRMCIKLIDE